MTPIRHGHQIWHVHDYWDPQLSRHLSQLRRKEPHTLVINIPAPNGAAWTAELAEELAQALGHTSVLDTGLRILPGDQTLDALTARWLGVNPDDVIIHRAGYSKTSELDHLLRLSAATNSRTWLLTNPGIPPAIAQLIGVHCADRTLTHEQFLHALDQRVQRPIATPKRSSARSQARSYPAVPTSNFPNFLARARVHLTPSQHRVVTTDYKQAHQLAQDLGDDLHAANMRGSGQDRQQALAAELTHHIAHNTFDSSLSRSVTRLRALQDGLLNRRWYLDVDLAQFTNGHAQLPNPTANVDAVARAALRAHRDPNDTGPALLQALGLSDLQIWQLRVDDVAIDGSALQLHGNWTPTPADAHADLATLYAAAELRGAAPHEPVCDWLTWPPYPRHLREATAGVVARLGHRCGRHARLPPTANEAQQMSNLGLTLVELANQPAETWDARSVPARRIGTTQTAHTLLSDPRHERRLSLTEATMLSMIRRGQPTPVVAHASVQRALVNLRAAGLIPQTPRR